MARPALIATVRGRSVRGRSVTTNEDRWEAYTHDEVAAGGASHFVAVIAGMSTIVSPPGISARLVHEAFQRVVAGAGEASPLEVLELAFQAAHEALRAERDPAHRDLGACCTTAGWCGTQLVLTHLGDTRAYLWRDGALTAKTRRDTLADTQPDAVGGAPHLASVLARWLGAKDTPVVRPQQVLVDLKAGDRIVLSTNGLHDLPDERIAQLLAANPAPEDAVDALLAAAKDCHGNATVVVIGFAEPAPRSPRNESDEALGEWAAPLAFLDGTTARELVRILRPLSSAMGVPRPRPHRAGELDGIAGIARKGPFERLVLSQWALLEAAPDEFMRRAAQGELLFHEPARKTLTTSRKLVAFVDTGPMLIGLPRLGVLACLLVLGQRGIRPFEVWLGGHGKWLYEGGPRLERVLAARSAREVTVGMIEAHLAEAAIGVDDEVWAIGSSRFVVEVRTRHPKVATLAIDESLTKPGWVTFDVHAPPRSAALELEAPSETTATRILNGQAFRPAAAAPAPAKPPPPARVPRPSAPPTVRVPAHAHTEALFLGQGKHILLRGHDGSIIDVRVPDVGAPVRRVRTLGVPTRAELVAVGVAGRRLPHLIYGNGHLVAKQLRGGSSDQEDRTAWARDPGLILAPHELRPLYVLEAGQPRGLPSFFASLGANRWLNATFSPQMGSGVRTFAGQVHTLGRVVNTLEAGLVSLEATQLRRLDTGVAVPTAVEKRLLDGLGRFVATGAEGGPLAVRRAWLPKGEPSGTLTDAADAIALTSHQSLDPTGRWEHKLDLIVWRGEQLLLRGMEGSERFLCDAPMGSTVLLDEGHHRVAICTRTVDGELEAIEVFFLWNGLRLLRIEAERGPRRPPITSRAPT